MPVYRLRGQQSGLGGKGTSSARIGKRQVSVWVKSMSATYPFKSLVENGSKSRSSFTSEARYYHQPLQHAGATI
jgi:hypothetical protein